MPAIRIKPELMEGATQDEVAVKLGIDRTLVCRFKAGHRVPNNKTLAQILIASGKTFDALFDVTGDAA